jgi:PAS domain S-box-containing protein
MIPGVLALTFMVAIFMWKRPFAATAIHKPTIFWYALRFRLLRLFSITHPAVIDSMSEGLIVLDKQWRIVNVNMAAVKIARQPALDLIAQPIDIICPGLSQQFQQQQKKRSEFHHDAEGRIYELCLTPLHNWRDQVRGHLLILHDITERKELELMRQDMTHSMVHDLRAPLSNSLFALQMLEKEINGQATTSTDQLLDLTITNTEKILQRVNKILDVGRLESNTMPIQPTAVSLPSLITNVLNTQASRLAEKELSIRTDFDDDLPQAWADNTLVERILQNLIDNSIKFTPSGGEIAVGVTATSPPRRGLGAGSLGAGSPHDIGKPALLISVSDNGTGIPRELQERIFDKFTTETAEGSSGLGLAFCKMVLEAHQQTIWVESEPGGGATFTFSLAVAPVSATAVA